MPAPDLLSKIDREITRNALKNERTRLDDAMFNLEFYHGDFSRFPVRAPGGSYDAARYPRHSLLMQRVVNTLTANLYRQGPGRKLVAPEGEPAAAYEAATAWLEGVYRRNRVDSLWQAADRLATVSDVAAFQVSATADPMKPVRVQLWDASQFCVWTGEDDPLAVEAVATLDLYDERRRLRVYTAEVVRTYLTDALGPGQTAGGTVYRLAGEAPNPLGVVPFSFVHFNEPVCDFWSGGPGCYLRSVNDGINFGMTEGFDCIRYNLRPIVLFRNVRPGWRPPSPIRPGDVWDLSAATNAADESQGEPSAEYLHADSSFVAAGWDDLQAYLDHVMEMVGVPPSSVRMTQTSARSGVAIVAEQLPLIFWAEGRQRPFARYEDDLAALVLAVGARHLGSQVDAGHRATARDLETVAADPCLLVRRPNMHPAIPGTDNDQGDQWLLDNHLSSRTQVLMKREQLSRDEAESRLEEIAADVEREQALFPPPAPGPGTARTGPSPGADQTKLDPAEQLQSEAGI